MGAGSGWSSGATASGLLKTVGGSDVEVIRSTRRHRTVQARRINGVIQVSIPAAFTAAEETHWVATMVSKFEGTGLDRDLAELASALADRYQLPHPRSIRWVDNQNSRWGSCTSEDGSIRISSKLKSEPLWVLDYVIVHELAHLLVAGHGPNFWALVDRYPRAERAKGWLMCRVAGL